MKTERSAARAGAYDALAIVDDALDAHCLVEHDGVGDYQPDVCPRCAELLAREDEIIAELGGL